MRPPGCGPSGQAHWSRWQRRWDQFSPVGASAVSAPSYPCTRPSPEPDSSWTSCLRGEHAPPSPAEWWLCTSSTCAWRMSPRRPEPQSAPLKRGWHGIHLKIFLQRLLWEQATVLAYLWPSPQRATGRAVVPYSNGNHFSLSPRKVTRLTHQWPVAIVGFLSLFLCSFSCHTFLGWWHF